MEEICSIIILWKHSLILLYTACDPDCLGGDAGLGLCTGLTSALCCNFYENDMCTDQCSGNLEPDPDANFECGKFIDKLKVAQLHCNTYAILTKGCTSYPVSFKLKVTYMTSIKLLGHTYHTIAGRKAPA